MARKGYRLVRRELLRAARYAADQYETTGRVTIREDFRGRLAGALSQIHMLAITEAVTRTRRLLKSGAPELELKFDWPELAKRFVQDFSAQYMAQKVTTIETSLHGLLTSAVKAGMMEGEGQEKLARRIRKMAPRLTQFQAARIARTEVHGASGYAGTKTAEILADDAIIEREWVAVEDERTRLSHSEADGQRRAIGEPFDVGGEKLMFPGDPAGSAGNIINCRCVVTEVLREG